MLAVLVVKDLLRLVLQLGVETDKRRDRLDRRLLLGLWVPAGGTGKERDGGGREIKR